MKFALNRTKKDCAIPPSALAVAGLKREKELRLEVENGVIVVLRPEMSAKKLLSVSEFLHNLATDMIVAVALECGECSCCGECRDDDDCECDYCDSHEECRGICIPDCLLKQAGIGKDQRWQADAENGVVSIRALPDGEDEDDPLLDEIPEPARLAFIENDLCIPRLRELLCGNDPIPF